MSSRTGRRIKAHMTARHKIESFLDGLDAREEAVRVREAALVARIKESLSAMSAAVERMEAVETASLQLERRIARHNARKPSFGSASREFIAALKSAVTGRRQTIDQQKET